MHFGVINFPFKKAKPPFHDKIFFGKSLKSLFRRRIHWYQNIKISLMCFFPVLGIKTRFTNKRKNFVKQKKASSSDSGAEAFPEKF